MIDSQFIKYIIKGHELYWDLLGNMRGNKNHKSSLCYLSGDIFYNYKVLFNKYDYEKQVDEIIKNITEKRIPDNLMITPDSFAFDFDLISFLVHKGFHIEKINSGMAKLLDDSKNITLPPKDINVFCVNDLYQLKISGTILNTVFEYDLFSFEHYLDAFNSPNVHFYMAECNGIPAGACMAIYGHDFVEIAWVGTINGYRKKGIAGYLINMIEKNAVNNNIKISVLSAYSNAINTYKRVGYKEHCKITMLRYQSKNKED